ncbi:hypothetical protein [Glycomyces xiaoerkulensis]|uniref:hypothetical protein n=1 Tax=Glycomyces xiaoerkulensis TaxID=2038139 RepID=UPI000C262167|nr:hypothetical protein [Glycomyces xiaoerkulensis]
MPDSIHVRFSRNCTAVNVGAMGAMSLPALFMVATFSRSFLVLVPCGIIAMIVLTAVLYRAGGITYVRVTPHRVIYRWMLGYIPINHQSKVDLYYGDSMVVTDDGLFIWRSGGGGYERVNLNCTLADPDDWARLRAWAALIWPQPPRAQWPRADKTIKARVGLAPIWGPQ